MMLEVTKTCNKQRRQSTQKTGGTTLHSLKAKILSTFACLYGLTQAGTVVTPLKQDSVLTADYPEIWEMDVVGGLSQGDKSWSYYQMTISERYFTGQESLAIKVIADAFGSDPDMFISRTNTAPTSTSNSDWHCVKKGSDTCIIRNTELMTWDTLFIGVRCLTPCQYTLASDYFTTQTLAQDVVTQYRLDGHSSSLFEFYVPQDANDGYTRAVTFTIEGEDPYNPIDLYFSLDDTINQIEERKVENLIGNGVGYYFTEDDLGWCTRCYVYLYVEITNPGRYYVSAKASARNPVILKDKLAEKFVNIRQQDCFQYFVQSDVNDLVVKLDHYQGQVDLYIAGQRVPNGPNDNDNVIIKATRSDSMQLILTAAERQRLGFRTGLYEICIYGYQDSSVAISPTEFASGNRFQVNDGQQATLSIQVKSAATFQYTQTFLKQKANITVQMQGLSLNTTINQAPPRLYYKICSSDQLSQCFLTATEQNGTDKGMTEISPKINQGDSMRQTVISHDPKNCPKQTSTTTFGCYYLFSVYYPDNTTYSMDASLFVTTYLAQSQNVSLDDSFTNVMVQGRFFYYQLLPYSVNQDQGISYLDSLTINVESIIGDADLFISTTNQLPTQFTPDTLSSEQMTERFESITLVKSENFTLTRPIYIGIYAASMVSYELTFTPVYSLQYQAKLSQFIPLNESQPYPKTFLTEMEEIKFSYFPWWSASEDRTIVFTANVTFNNIFFYAKANDFPQFYTTEWQDQSDIIAIPSSDYSVTDGFFIRVRPDFALYDLISQREYIFNFIAFSQMNTAVDAGKFSDLYCNESQLGYANGSSNFYRHYLIDKNSTLNITVTAIQGNPSILIKLANDPSYPVSSDPSTYDQRVDATDQYSETGNVEFFRIDPSWRYDQDIFCDKAGYTLQGGNTICTIYIAIECPEACVYNVVMQMEGRDQGLTAAQASRNIPIYLAQDNYYTGSVGLNQVKYFYYPVTRTTGDTVIFLNKTGPLGRNGDSRLIMFVQNDAGSIRSVNQTSSFDNWQYPNASVYQTSFPNKIIVSQTNVSTQPEMIELCPRTFELLCTSNASCVLILAVVGQTANAQSNFRLTAYTQSNRLYDKNPIQGNIALSGQYQYYWFSNNASVQNPNADWEHIIAVSVEGFNGQPSQDVDLFVSVMDARYPTSEDYDYKSDNQGPDDIYIRSTDNLWARKGYNKSNGIVFVVGVKALTDNVNYTLVMGGPSRFTYDYQILTSSRTGTFPRDNNPQNNFQLFRWFNWGQRDFKITVDVIEGQVNTFMNTYSERNFRTNGYLAIPVSASNSLWINNNNGTQGMKIEQRIGKEDPSMFCYYCWYYVMVRTTWTNLTTNYRLSITTTPDGGEEVVAISNNNVPVSLSLPSTATSMQRKFILDNKEPFKLTAQVRTGNVFMYVSPVPAMIQKALWKKECLAGTTCSINVKTSDSNFNLGTFYYVILQSTAGRVDLTLTLSQTRQVNELQPASDGTYKEVYWTTEERAKFYFFQVPKGRTWQRVSFNISATTKDFYPTVLVQKNIFTAAPVRDKNFAQSLLAYPNFSNYSFMLGDNFTQYAQQSNFNLSFRDFANTTWTYYTVAVFSWSYGLTDTRKHEFELTLLIDQINSQLGENLEKPKYYQLPFLRGDSSENALSQNLVKQWLENRVDKVKEYFGALMLA